MERKMADEKTRSPEAVRESLKVRWITYSWALLGGMDRSVMIPVMWLYLVTEWSKSIAEKYYGVCASGYYITVIFSSAIVTIICHKKLMRTKTLMILLNVIAIIGNALYSIGIAPWLVAIGRLITGLSGSGNIPLFAETIQTTPKESRTRIPSFAYALFVVGLSIGPAFNIFVGVAELYPWTKTSFSPYKIPGMIMAAMHIIHLIICIIFYPYELKHPIEDEDEPTESTNSFSLHPEIFNLKMMSLVVAVSGAFFTFLCIETATGILTVEYFKWNTFKISSVFVAYGACTLTGYIVVGCITKHISDFTLLSVGCIVKMAVNILFVVIFFTLGNTLTSKILFLTAYLTQVVGDCFIIAAGEGIYSKTISPHLTPLAQGIMKWSGAVGICFGSVVAGSIPVGSYYFLLGVVVFATTLFFCILLIVAYRTDIFRFFRPEIGESTPLVEKTAN